MRVFEVLGNGLDLLLNPKDKCFKMVLRMVSDLIRTTEENVTHLLSYSDSQRRRFSCLVCCRAAHIDMQQLV
jgi:hypothetical protein